MSEFVSFQIAKKLEEKGFILDYNLYGYKPVYSDVNTIKLIWNIGAYEKDYFGENIPCPTIAQVLKWLREKKGIHITICVCGDGWFYEVIHISSGKSLVEDYEDDMIQSYEETTLAGIEYALDNLI